MTMKIDQLAIASGTPAFPEMLHVGRPNVGDQERLMGRIREMLDRRYFTNNGPFVQELEARIAEHAGVGHCVAMCNATVALEIAIRALGLTGEVVVPSLTFVATAHALQWQRITPVFADIAPGTHHLDPEQVERVLTPRTTGIIGVHLWGQPCDVEGLEELARRRNLALLFDAAHAFGCSHRGRRVGGFGDAEVFSFHATKFCNSFEGGAVVTDDGELAEKMRLMRNFGFAGFDKVVYIGTNGKMSEVCAAMGLTSLEALDEFIAVNRRNYEEYRGRLDGLPGLTLFRYDGGEGEGRNYQYVIMEVDPRKAGLTRDELQAVLVAENVMARRYFWPGCHRMEPYCSYYPNAYLLLPETERVAARLLSVPTGTAVDGEAIGRICDVIRTALAHPEAVRRLLQARGQAARPGVASPRPVEVGVGPSGEVQDEPEVLL
jgi:dTDP-4-amino-4,6-dideoxygalactose transaminase